MFKLIANALLLGDSKHLLHFTTKRALGLGLAIIGTSGICILSALTGNASPSILASSVFGVVMTLGCVVIASPSIIHSHLKVSAELIAHGICYCWLLVGLPLVALVMNDTHAGVTFIWGMLALNYFSTRKRETIVLSVVLPYVVAGVWVSVVSNWTFTAEMQLSLLGHLAAVLAAILLAGVELYQRNMRFASTRSLLGVMAHELRTPLASISMIVGFYEQIAADSPPEKKAELDAVNVTAARVIRQMNAIIDMQISNSSVLSRAGLNEMVNLKDLVTSALSGYPFRSKLHADSVHLAIPEDLNTLGSTQLLSLVFINLLKNALTAIETKGLSPQLGDIRVEATEDAKWIRLNVVDRGCGMTITQVDRIFEPFFSTSPEAAHGLGMTFVKQVIALHRGFIKVDSTHGVGTSVCIKLRRLPRKSLFATSLDGEVA